MIEQIKYINHLNEVIEFGKDGIFVNYNTLRDYSWDITSANNKIASFKKGIVSKTIPIIIKCHSEEEGIEIRNRLFEVFEKDVLAKKNGRIVIGEYYLKCYITGSKKTKYLISDGYMHLSLTMKSDYPAWIKESYSIFRPKSALNTSESAEGREILIGNATNSILTNYGVYGRSEQKSYTGKNLLENTKGTFSNGGVVFTENSDGSITVEGTSTTDNCDYYINGSWSNTDNILPIESGSFISAGTGTSDIHHYIIKDSKILTYALTGVDRSFDVTDGGINGVFFRVPNGTTVNHTFYPMIRKADTDATYEKYVGGEASPNPSYPQDIESVADIGKNQIENSAISQTINGVKFTVKPDGSVVVNGTAEAETRLEISKQILPVGNYIASGGYDENCDFQCLITNGGAIAYTAGQGNPFDVVVTDTTTLLTFSVCVPSGATVDNKTVYPMVRKADIADDTYEPPFNFIRVNTNSKNLLNISKISGTTTWNGITYTLNDDKSITFSGTATALSYIGLDYEGVLPIGESFICSISKERISGFQLAFGYFIADGTYKTISNGWIQTSGTVVIPDDYVKNRIVLQIASGTTLNTTIYPMIRKASIEDDSYAPYNASKATIILNDSLRGIKVTEGGNFTDETGQQWVCDTLEKYADGSGKHTQRVHELAVTSSDVNSVSNGVGYINCNKRAKGGKIKVLCTHYADAKTSDTGWTVFFNDEVNCADIDTFKAFVDENNIKICYPLLEPIETDLTAEQIAEIEKLQTFEGVTYITNNDDAYQTTTYSIMQYLDFPYGYEYDFTADFDSDELLNTSFVPVDFRMVIHGAITNPSVFIAGHEYSVDVVVEQGDYLTIDSQAKTIVLSKQDGTQVNCFNNRNRDSYVFEKIPSGKNEITSTGDLNMDITLLDERSEPRWI